MKGQDKCDKHGAKAPQSLAAAERRLVEQEAARLLALHNPNAQPVDNAMDALRRLAGVIQQAFDVAGQRVNDLSTVSSVDAKGTEQLRAQVQLWQALMGQLRPVLVDIERLSTEERVVRLAEERAAAEISGWSRLVEAWLVFVLTREGLLQHPGLVSGFGAMWDGLARRALPPGMEA